MKKCTKCKNLLPLSEFYRNRSKKGGLHDLCAKCTVINWRNWYVRNIERARETSRRWAKNNLEKRKSSIKKYCQNHRKEILERNKNYRAKLRYLKKLNVPTGAVRVECPFCGVIGSVYFYKNIYRCFECIRDENEERIKNVTIPPKIVVDKPRYIPELPRKFVSVLNERPRAKCKRCSRLSTDIQFGWCPDCRIIITMKKKAIPHTWMQ